MSKDITIIESGTEIINETAVSSLLKISETLSMAKGMIPKEFDTIEKVFAALQLGFELGLKPMTSLRSIYIVNGKPALYGDAMLGLAMRTGQVEDVNEYYDDNKKAAVCEIKRSTLKTPTIRFYTEDDVSKNPNANNPKNFVWKNNRRRMMQMRARAFALRDAFPDVLSGIYDEFEAQEIEENPQFEANEIKQVNLDDTLGPEKDLNDALGEPEETTQQEPQAQKIEPEPDSPLGMLKSFYQLKIIDKETGLTVGNLENAGNFTAIKQMYESIIDGMDELSLKKAYLVGQARSIKDEAERKAISNAIYQAEDEETLNRLSRGMQPGDQVNQSIEY